MALSVRYYGMMGEVGDGVLFLFWWFSTADGKLLWRWAISALVYFACTIKAQRQYIFLCCGAFILRMLFKPEPI